MSADVAAVIAADKAWVAHESRALRTYNTPNAVHRLSSYIAAIEAVIGQHRGTHSCRGSWYTDDPWYRGKVALREPCPTLAAIAVLAPSTDKEQQ